MRIHQEIPEAPFFVKPPKLARDRVQANLVYTPIDISRHFNRGLNDKVDGDGQGGWTDQGPNDMSRLPTGPQKLDGIPYLVGTADSGAILFDNEKIKPGGFPKSVRMDVNAAYSELYLLHTFAWGGKGELAVMTVNYADGSSEKQPIEIGKHILDWWANLAWQNLAVLNDNQCSDAWQGPNRHVSNVVLYCLRWVNPNPERTIASVEITKSRGNPETCYLVLGLTGGNPKEKAKAPANSRVFHVGLDGHPGAVNFAGEETMPSNARGTSWESGRFVPGVKKEALEVKHVLVYPRDTSFPLEGRGTISMFLKADDWRGEELQARFKKTPYTTTMTPFDMRNADRKTGEKPWRLSFQVNSKTLASLELSAVIADNWLQVDVTDMVVPGQWFSLITTWGPDSEKENHTRYELYFNGKLVADRVRSGKPDEAVANILIGVAGNGGNKWCGCIDEFSIFNYRFTPDLVQKYLAGFSRDQTSEVGGQ